MTIRTLALALAACLLIPACSPSVPLQARSDPASLKILQSPETSSSGQRPDKRIELRKSATSAELGKVDRKDQKGVQVITGKMVRTNSTRRVIAPAAVSTPERTTTRPSRGSLMDAPSR